jgi:hypothetical protein
MTITGPPPKFHGTRDNLSTLPRSFCLIPRRTWPLTDRLFLRTCARGRGL